MQPACQSSSIFFHIIACKVPFKTQFATQRHVEVKNIAVVEFKKLVTSDVNKIVTVDVKDIVTVSFEKAPTKKIVNVTLKGHVVI